MVDFRLERQAAEKIEGRHKFDAPNNHETLSLLDYGFVMYAMESIVVESITRYWSDGFLRTFVRQRDNSNWEMDISLGEMNLVWDGCNENHMQEIRNALRTQQMGNPNEAPY